MGFVLLLVIMISTLWITGLVSPWSPDFKTQQINPAVFQASTAQVQDGAKLFYERGCQYCHAIDVNNQSVGGQRGPDLSTVGSRLNKEQMVVRILNGGNNMPAFGTILKPEELDALVAFLQTRKIAEGGHQGQVQGLPVSLTNQNK
jgi:ubiquinol-cytochrome c reductase cytochrome b subunit